MADHGDQAPAETTSAGPPAEAVPHLRADALPVVACEAEAEPGDMVLVPWTGQVVDRDDVPALAVTLADVREHEARVAEVKRGLSQALAEQAELRGTRTLNLGDGRKAKVSGDTETVYDAEAIETDLRAAGMPEDRIREIVREEVTYRVVAVEANRAAKANPAYAAIIDRHKTTRPKTPSVSLEGFRFSR